MIRKLPKEVINKIAAGEVIQRPYNVIKELTENAVDAEATQIRVSILNGGMKSIEIVDNGKGIRREDFPLLCERFATSKMAELGDLDTIQSFGFRGEALASLSYVSALEVASKHRDENIAYRCSFKNEKMLEEPEPLSMNSGTKIQANDLFGGLETRRSSLNAGQQKKRIIRLVSHFALHYNEIKFSVETEKGQEFGSEARGVSASAGKMKVFQMITKLSYDKFTYLAKEVLEDIKVEGVITKLNTIKGKTLLLNVNGRIVENPDIIRMVQKSYSECYQSIHEDNEGFFVYLSIEIDPRKIDCNLHPSKKVVGFFGADKIYDNIYRWILEHVKEESSIKNIATNIPSKANPFSQNMQLNFKSQAASQIGSASQGNDQLLLRPDKMAPKDREKPVYDFQKNRTDSLQMPINFYMKGKEEEGSVKCRELRYNMKANQKDQLLSQNVRKFFQCVSYVGCFNLNHIFIHIDSRLYLMNLLPCLESFFREWLPNNPLIVHEIVDEARWMDLRSMILRFLRAKKLEGRIDVEQAIEKILINKYLLAKEYGIVIEEAPNGRDGVITAFPVFEKFMADCLIQDELAYFLCRLFAREASAAQAETFFLDFLTNYFEQAPAPQNSIKSSSTGPPMELSPMNDLYSQYFRDKVLPVLKTKGRDFRQIQFTDFLTEMVNMKHVYKIFQRC